MWPAGGSPGQLRLWGEPRGPAVSMSQTPHPGVPERSTGRDALATQPSQGAKPSPATCFPVQSLCRCWGWLVLAAVPCEDTGPDPENTAWTLGTLLRGLGRAKHGVRV